MEPVQDILNFLQVNDNIASSGQPRASQFPSIAASGYSMVINLAMPNSPNALANEADLVTDLGMVYKAIPVPFDKPEAFHFEQFVQTMNAARDRKIWVHCALNYRVSAFLYLYFRKVLNTSEQIAKMVWLSNWEADETWKAFIAIQLASD